MTHLQFRLLKDVPYAKAGSIVDRMPEGFRSSNLYRCENGANFWIPISAEKEFLELIDTPDPAFGDTYRAAYTRRAKECSLIEDLLRKHYEQFPEEKL